MGNEYFAIAFDFDKGAFNAYYLSNNEGDQNDRDNYKLGEVAVDSAPDGFIASRIRNNYNSVVFIPKESFENRKDRKLAGRFVGAKFTNYSKEGSQPYSEKWYIRQFDAIIIIKNTSATQLLVDSSK